MYIYDNELKEIIIEKCLKKNKDKYYNLILNSIKYATETGKKYKYINLSNKDFNLENIYNIDKKIILNRWFKLLSKEDAFNNIKFIYYDDNNRLVITVKMIW